MLRIPSKPSLCPLPFFLNLLNITSSASGMILNHVKVICNQSKPRILDPRSRVYVNDDIEEKETLDPSICTDFEWAFSYLILIVTP